EPDDQPPVSVVFFVMTGLFQPAVSAALSPLNALTSRKENHEPDDQPPVSVVFFVMTGLFQPAHCILTTIVPTALRS
ncbi:hypothetical protein, partial [Anaplasma marginale]|uniref:hypothetical protein n=1 Tax=Anaplasma marginale TaxID=770 RepID=UPI001CDA8489